MKCLFRIINKILKGIEIAIEVFIKATLWGTCLFLIVQALSFVNWRYNLIDLSVEDTFYVENADLKDIGKTAENAVQPVSKIKFDAHHISEGKNIVIGFRSYNDPVLIAYDEEVFNKLTLWLPELPVGEAVYDLSQTDTIKAIYSYGASAWPETVCSQLLESGNVTVIAQTNSINVRLNSEVLGDNHLCNAQALNFNFNAQKIEYKDVTPWLGLKGEYIYDETYRPFFGK